MAATQSYGYDPLGRLSSARLAPAPAPPTSGWSYDAANRLTQIAHLGQATTTLNYDAADQLTSSTSAAGTTTYSFDARGNRIKAVGPLGGTSSFTYDQGNRLTSYTGPVVNATAPGTVTTTSYTYQADGLRADLAWDRAEGLPLILSSPVQVPGGIQEYVTGPGGRLVEIDLLPIAGASGTVGGTPFTTTQTVYVHTDAMVSTRVLTDASGLPLINYTYDAYGQATLNALGRATTAIVDPMLFQGQYVDPVTGLLYLRARWYDPATAQFVSADPLSTSTGLPYAFAANDPINRSDPTGLCAVGPLGPACPQWLKDVAQTLGYGSIPRFLLDLFEGKLSLHDLLELGSTGAQKLVPLILKLSANATIKAVGIVLDIALGPISIGATVADGLCSLFDTLNQLQSRAPLSRA